MFKMKTRGAIEFSMVTIIVIVLSVMILIFAGIFIKNIMCAGIIITDKITDNVENEIINLFGANDYGVKCMGEEGQEIRLGDGGQRQIVCVINTDRQTEYKLEVIEAVNLETGEDLDSSWILDQDWEGTVAPGQKTVSVLVLNLPQKVSNTNLKITIKETNVDTDVSDTHTSYINIVHVSGLTSAIC